MNNKTKFLLLLGRTKIIKKELALNFFSEEEIEELIESQQVHERNNQKGITFYGLNDSGEIFLKKNAKGEISRLFRCFSEDTCFRLSEHYLEKPDDVKKTWRTRDDYICELKEVVPIDAVYTQNNCLYGVKVIGTEADPKLIEEIKLFAEKIGLQRIEVLRA